MPYSFFDALRSARHPDQFMERYLLPAIASRRFPRADRFELEHFSPAVQVLEIRNAENPGQSFAISLYRSQGSSLGSPGESSGRAQISVGHAVRLPLHEPDWDHAVSRVGSVDDPVAWRPRQLLGIPISLLPEKTLSLPTDSGLQKAILIAVQENKTTKSSWTAIY